MDPGFALMEALPFHISAAFTKRDVCSSPRREPRRFNVPESAC